MDSVWSFLCFQSESVDLDFLGKGQNVCHGI